MSLDRRQLLRGSLAAGAAAVPLGALAAPALGAEREGRAAKAAASDFYLALLDVKNKIIENHYTAHITQNAKGEDIFGAPTSTFSPGWAPLECKFRTLRSGESVFMVCGGTETFGNVTIHRISDSAGLGWATGLPNYPHSLEYLPTADVVIVVGTRGLDELDPPPPQLPGGPEPRPGGSFELYTAPTKDGPSSFKKIEVADKDRVFRQAHGVVLDQNRKDLVWIFGGNKILAYQVSGWRECVKLSYIEKISLTDQENFENGHDLQPDPKESQYLWATGSKHLLRINKSAQRPRVDWTQPPAKAKSFSWHSSGRGIYTADTLGNKFGSEKVEFLRPAQTVRAEPRGQQDPKWIYKARLTDIPPGALPPSGECPS